jgi:hypothetical protein
MQKRTQSADIATLHEEIEAWERGLHLGRRLSLRFSMEKFDKLRCRCLATRARGVGVLKGLVCLATAVSDPRTVRLEHKLQDIV